MSGICKNVTELYEIQELAQGTRYFHVDAQFVNYLEPYQNSTTGLTATVNGRDTEIANGPQNIVGDSQFDASSAESSSGTNCSFDDLEANNIREIEPVLSSLLMLSVEHFQSIAN